MKKSMFSKFRIGALLGALVTAGGLVAASSSAVADTSSNGRDLFGTFCGGRCISLTFNEAVTTSIERADFELRPGTYWLTVTDTFSFHNFVLRRPDGSEQVITEVGPAPGLLRVKIQLTPGSYRLLCTAFDHEMEGMYVDFEVGGEGQGA